MSSHQLGRHQPRHRRPRRRGLGRGRGERGSASVELVVLLPLLFAQSEMPVQKEPWPTAGGIRSEASKPMAVAPVAMAFATFSL